MSLYAGIAFIKLCREAETARGQLAALPAPLAWEDMVALGQRHDLEFTVHELQSAIAVDWAMRRARYTRPG